MSEAPKIMTRASAQSFRLGVQAFLRDWRAGELRLLLLALMVAVAAMTSVGFLADRAGQVLERDAAQMLGGDLVVRSPNPLPDDFHDEAARLGLAVGHAVQFPSMAMYGDSGTLVSLKAVDDAYPLRGALQVSHAADQPAQTVSGGPAPGTTWVDDALLGALGATVGDRLEVGALALEVTAIIRHEPDRGTQFVNLAPRLLMHRSDLDASGLLGPGSRVHHYMLVAGEPAGVRAFQHWLEPRLQRGQRLSTLEDSRPEVTRVLERAERFLVLVALMAVLVAAIAVGLAARQYTRRHTDGIAILRCLGAPRGVLLGMLWVEFALVALVGSTAGIALGFAAHYGLVDMLSGWLETPLPAPSVLPAIQGWVSGSLLLLGFALPPLTALRHVPPARVLRRDSAAGGVCRSWPAYAVATVAFLLLIASTTGDLATSLTLVAGFAAAFLVFAVAGLALLWGLRRLRGGEGGALAWRFALTGMARRRSLTVVQLCSLALGLMLLLLLGILRGDLLRSWQQSLPPDAPNTFLINVQPDQRNAVRVMIAEAGLPRPDLHPLVRARLVAINDRPVHPDDYTEERAQRLADREFNLSVAEQLPASNVIVAGRWLDPGASEMSLEEGVAQSLRVSVGDVLRFDVAGRQVDVTVSGLRKVRWDSFEVNFFALLSPAALPDAAASYLTSLHIPPAGEALKHRIVQAWPNITVFDIGVIVAQVRQMLERTVVAVQLLFGFTVFAGVLVLAAALHATRDERMHEVAVMRALGARADLLRAALFRELVLCGALAGVLAAAASVSLAWVLADRVLQVELVSVWWPWPAGIVAGVAAALLAGRFALAGVLRVSPLTTLREVA